MHAVSIDHELDWPRATNKRIYEAGIAAYTHSVWINVKAKYACVYLLVKVKESFNNDINLSCDQILHIER